MMKLKEEDMALNVQQDNVSRLPKTLQTTWVGREGQSKAVPLAVDSRGRTTNGVCFEVLVNPGSIAIYHQKRQEWMHSKDTLACQGSVANNHILFLSGCAVALKSTWHSVSAMHGLNFIYCGGKDQINLWCKFIDLSYISAQGSHLWLVFTELKCCHIPLKLILYYFLRLPRSVRWKYIRWCQESSNRNHWTFIFPSFIVLLETLDIFRFSRVKLKLYYRQVLIHQPYFSRAV